MTYANYYNKQCLCFNRDEITFLSWSLNGKKKKQPVLGKQLIYAIWFTDP